MKRGLLAVMVVAVTALAMEARAAEHAITREQLPPAVATAVDQETKGATIKGFAIEREHGAKVYEAETVISGHTRDLQFSASGELMEVEEEVALPTLPGKVRDGLHAQAKQAQITKVESLTKRGRLVAYEAATVRDGRKGEVQVGPEGSRLAHPE